MSVLTVWTVNWLTCSLQQAALSSCKFKQRSHITLYICRSRQYQICLGWFFRGKQGIARQVCIVRWTEGRASLECTSYRNDMSAFTHWNLLITVQDIQRFCMLRPRNTHTDKTSLCKRHVSQNPNATLQIYLNACKKPWTVFFAPSKNLWNWRLLPWCNADAN